MSWIAQCEYIKILLQGKIVENYAPLFFTCIVTNLMFIPKVYLARMYLKSQMYHEYIEHKNKISSAFFDFMSQ